MDNVDLVEMCEALDISVKKIMRGDCLNQYYTPYDTHYVMRGSDILCIGTMLIIEKFIRRNFKLTKEIK